MQLYYCRKRSLCQHVKVVHKNLKDFECKDNTPNAGGKDNALNSDGKDSGPNSDGKYNGDIDPNADGKDRCHVPC